MSLLLFIEGKGVGHIDGEEDLFYNLHEMYLHNETYRTYVLFAKVQIRKLLGEGQPNHMTGFEEVVYMSRDVLKHLTEEQSKREYYFPVSVMVVEENYEVQEPPPTFVTEASVIALANAKRRGKRQASGKGSKKNQSSSSSAMMGNPHKQRKTHNCAIIRLLATTPSLQNKGYGSALVAKYLEQRKTEVSRVYAITKMNEKYFTLKEHNWRTLFSFYSENPVSDKIKQFYDDYEQQHGWNDYSKMMELRADTIDDESEPEMERVPHGEKYPEYKDMNEKYAKLLRKFGFKCECPHNSSFNNDQDNAIKLNHEGHVMVLEVQPATSYKNRAKIDKRESQVVLDQCPVYNLSNNQIESLRYMSTNHNYHPTVNDELTFDDFFENGYFQTYNHMWHWTMVKRESLENDPALIHIVKATVVNSEYLISDFGDSCMY